MNRQEEIYFEALTKDRAENAKTLEKRSMRGVRNSVVEKYSDQAHFIYELLQNADDAKATSVRFVLEHRRLIFAHNGTRHFSVSDPLREDEDSESGKLGDINAITSVGNSNKTEASIGKFGVGFKAVFQYTSTPHIYDQKFRFRIERFVVPIPIDDDFPGRKKAETLFVFPFDHPERNPEQAYNEIAEKLRNLSHPLLFLSGIKKIDFEFFDFELGDVTGSYQKIIKNTLSYGDTTAEHISLTKSSGFDLQYDVLEKKDLWLFSRRNNVGSYSVGFFMDSNGHLVPVSEPAFCFFPTKEFTGLKFILHAPFLLTDSREGIRAGVVHNERMIESLAELAADAFEYLRDIGEKSSVRLIDDNIVKIIPVDPDKFSEPSDKSKVSFLPFYDAIKEKFKEADLLPTADGYTSSKNAYWVAVPRLPQLFSDSQLAMITDNENAHWVFRTLGRDDTHQSNRTLSSYIESLVRTYLNEDVILGGRSEDYFNIFARGQQSSKVIKGITATFIESQTFEWLHDFYNWLSETKNRRDLSKTKPFFLNQNRKAVAAFDDKNQLILFLPGDGVEGYTVVHPELLRNPDTKQFLVEIGIKQPELKDRLYNMIRSLSDKKDEDLDSFFKMIFKYYREGIHNEVSTFIDSIKDVEFLAYYCEGDTQMHYGRASSMYLPKDELKKYFETTRGIRFIAIDKYRKLLNLPEEKDDELISFLTGLGVKDEISVISLKISGYSSGRYNYPVPDRYNREYGLRYEETVIEGCKEIVRYIVGGNDTEKSVLLWNSLLRIIRLRGPLDHILRGNLRYHYRTDRYEEFTSSCANLLRKSEWITNNEGRFVSPNSLCLEELSDVYDTTSEYAAKLFNFLGIKETTSSEDDKNLTDEQRVKMAMANMLIDSGINLDNLPEFLREYKLKMSAEEAKKVAEHDHDADNADSNRIDTDDNPDDFEHLLDNGDESDTASDDASSPESLEKKKSINASAGVIKDIIRRTKDKYSESSSSAAEDDEDEDKDEYLPSTVDYSKKIERAKEESASEIKKIIYLEGLYNKAVRLTQDGKYTADWFNTLLKLESLKSYEANSDSKEVSISFARVEREPGTKRTLILKHPNRYIPRFMEDLANIPLVLHTRDQVKTIEIEVASVKSYTLLVKMKDGASLGNIDLESVTEARIDAKSPVFLLEELKKRFAALELPGDFNLKDNLCENIEFVFGPPGTGKTTHLARDVLIPMMKNNPECKVLVLTPTNKSADVLVKRIMEVSGNDTSYINWLIRFGGTGDEKIEESPVFKDKIFDINSRAKNVTVTTIARFPYDYFILPQGGPGVHLCEMDWDYIVIDEASMIPIANIIFPLYKSKPGKFIIAGDPFQIEPITAVDLWKNENIYTLVELNSFENPKTVPHRYKVELLTTQYRSVPAIGDVFSKFAYDGILKHHRSAASRRELNLGDELGIETLNIIKYPVSKYESIYRAKRLQHSSPYQIYSALFTFEYVCYLSKIIAERNPGSLFRIGIVAPYRAQADMIDKLFASEKLPSEVDVQVGTIHGFQGDECDIIFVVFNTPPSISRSKEMFLNRLNIINVSVSRARDYLFVVMPDDDTEGISNLVLLKRIESLIQNTTGRSEFMSPYLEELMFSDSKYLENNTFSTSHQSVNVYGLPEKRYEVRTEEHAVDVQIHRGAQEVIALPVGLSEKRYELRTEDYTLDARIPEEEQEVIVSPDVLPEIHYDVRTEEHAADAVVTEDAPKAIISSTDLQTSNAHGDISSPDNVTAIKSKTRRGVVKCDKNGRVLKEYTSQGAAARDNGVRSIDISNWVLGKGKDPRGYIWKRYGDLTDEHTADDRIIEDVPNAIASPTDLQISNVLDEVSSRESIEKIKSINATEGVTKDIAPETEDNPSVSESVATEDLKTFCGYFITRDGKVIGRAGGVRKPNININGYYEMRFYHKRKQIFRTIHSIVAELYLPKPDKSYEGVRHINGDKLDNRVENLEWVPDNVELIAGKKRYGVVKCDEDGNVLKEYISQSAAARDNGVRSIDISNRVLGNVKDPRGYIWKRYEDLNDEQTETVEDSNEFDNDITVQEPELTEITEEVNEFDDDVNVQEQELAEVVEESSEFDDDVIEQEPLLTEVVEESSEFDDDVIEQEPELTEVVEESSEFDDDVIEQEPGLTEVVEESSEFDNDVIEQESLLTEVVEESSEFDNDVIEQEPELTEITEESSKFDDDVNVQEPELTQTVDEQKELDNDITDNEPELTQTVEPSWIAMLQRWKTQDQETKLTETVDKSNELDDKVNAQEPELTQTVDEPNELDNDITDNEPEVTQTVEPSWIAMLQRWKTQNQEPEITQTVEEANESDDDVTKQETELTESIEEPNEPDNDVISSETLFEETPKHPKASDNDVTVQKKPLTALLEQMKASGNYGFDQKTHPTKVLEQLKVSDNNVTDKETHLPELHEHPTEIDNDAANQDPDLTQLPEHSDDIQKDSQPKKTLLSKLLFGKK